ncbi:MAG: DUF86 domain-containing protein [Chloroflexi bacterium]|nr:DUF86 domain-containing protein [Chloroflexota bacterium]
MPNFDIARINAHRKTIEDNLQHLETKRGRAFEEFARDRDGKDAVKYQLQTAIQALMDITNHLCARLRLKVAENSGECVRALEREGLIPQAHATQYAKMIRFRNVLVHLYGEVDERQVYEIVENNLNDFRQFLVDIDTIVERHQAKEQSDNPKKTNGKRSTKKS